MLSVGPTHRLAPPLRRRTLLCGQITSIRLTVGADFGVIRHESLLLIVANRRLTYEFDDSFVVRRAIVIAIITRKIEVIGSRQSEVPPFDQGKENLGILARIRQVWVFR